MPRCTKNKRFTCLETGNNPSIRL